MTVFKLYDCQQACNVIQQQCRIMQEWIAMWKPKE
jgi:hypothetical protein